jgi:hypothetical protein
MPFTPGQQRALAVLPKITGFSSAILSIVIAITIFRDKKKLSKVYHRLILGMSCADISSSLSLATSTWPIPKESGILWAVGNTTSCTFQGLFVQFGISSPVYNVSLSFYYLLAIRYSWKEDQMKKMEPLFHLVPLVWAFGTGIAGLFLKIFNNANLWCWIASYPGRTEDADVYRWAMFYGPLWLSIWIVTIHLILVFLFVRSVTLGSEKYAYPVAQGGDDDAYYDQGFSTHDYSSTGAPRTNKSRVSFSTSIRNSIKRRPHPQSQFAKRRREVANQCLRYALAFYITWIPITVRTNGTPRASPTMAVLL